MIPQPKDGFTFALMNMVFSPKSSEQQRLWGSIAAIQVAADYQSRRNYVFRAVIAHRRTVGMVIIKLPDKEEGRNDMQLTPEQKAQALKELSQQVGTFENGDPMVLGDEASVKALGGVQ